MKTSWMLAVLAGSFADAHKKGLFSEGSPEVDYSDAEINSFMT